MGHGSEPDLTSVPPPGQPPQGAPNTAPRGVVAGWRDAAGGAAVRTTSFLVGYARSWRAWRDALASLQDPQYKRYFWANFISVGGTWMQRIGQDWLVLELTESPVALGITMAMQFAPILFGAVLAGGIVDRSDLRGVLLRTQSVMAGLAIGLAALTWSGVVQLWMVWVFAAALGVVETFDNPARHKLISRLVGRSDVANAVALNSASYNLGRLVGPSVAGGMIAAAGLAVAFLANALSFLPMFMVLWGIRVPRTDTGENSTPGTGRGALRYVFSQPTVRRSLALMLVVSIFAHNFRVLLPLLVLERFDGGPGMYGTLLACMGVGALFGGMGAAQAGAPSIRRLIAAGLWFGSLVLLIAASTLFLQLVAVLVLAGGTNTFFNVTARSLELLASHEDYRARVMSVHQVVFVGTTPIGALLLGWIAEVGDVALAFVVAAAVILISCFWSVALGHRSDVAPLRP